MVGTKKSVVKRSPYRAMQARRRAERLERNRIRRLRRRRQLHRRLLRYERQLDAQHNASMLGSNAILESDSTDGSVISELSADTESDSE
jgi:hypothetical protein